LVEDSSTLKNLKHIAIFFFFTFAVSLGAKSSPTNPLNTSPSNCKVNQEGEASSQKPATVPSDMTLNQESSYKSEIGETKEPELTEEVASSAEPIIKPDSTISSISKYNYLFYFIYKYKFENRFRLDQIEKLVTD
jgi:hypothetical protein